MRLKNASVHLFVFDLKIPLNCYFKPLNSGMVYVATVDNQRLQHHTMRHMMSVCPVIHVEKLDHLVQVSSPRSLHYN